MRRILTIGLILFLLLLILAGGLALLIRRSFPQTSGEVNLPGLHSPVDVLRDGSGIPQIYAQDEHDLFMAQGYVHAQDRFWQMDFWRHVGAGRLAEMFGESQVKTDAFIRTLGWARIAEQEWKNTDDDSRQILQAYADGVNAYLESHRGSQLSFEYAILGLINSAYQPEPWLTVHSLTWGKAMAWDLGGNMESELHQAVLLPQLGAARLADLNPPYPAENPLILPDFSLASAGPSAPPLPTIVLASRGALLRVAARVDALNRLTGGGAAGLGSNNWVIAGSRSTTGSPILANDTHLGIRMPSIWYENALHCETVSETCRFNVAGFSFAGVPGVVIGHNDRIAWGITNNNPDVQDLYLERINPDNPDQYEVNGEWLDMEVREEIIQVAGGLPVTIHVRNTRHGPVVSDADEELGALAESTGIEQGAPMAVSLQWTALAPASIYLSLLQLDRAHDFDEFRAALQSWNVPAQNFVYADVDGNIGYQLPGQVPIRRSGDGSFPQPGWTDKAEWIGFIPFEDLPYSLNPDSGYIASANNATVGPSYPYLLTTQPDLGYRAARIVQLLQAKEVFSPGDMRQIQGDTANPMAPVLTPYLLGLDFHEDGETEAERTQANVLDTTLAVLDGWDYRNEASSAPAALFNAVWRHLILRTFGDDLPTGWLPGDEVAFAIVTGLLDRPGDPWWDDLRTPPIETRDEILRLAVADGVEELQARLGKNAARWTWGALHGATFRNESLGESGILPIEALFNRGPYPTGGGAAIVDATGWSYEDGYQVDWVPSERLVLDLSDWDAAKAIHTTGQSGHTFDPHYVDMASRWAAVEYLPLPWTKEAVEAQTVETLRLVP